MSERTIGGVLYGDDVAAGLGEKMSSDVLDAIRSDLDGATSTVMPTIRRELAGAVSGFLDLELTEVAAAGWAKHRDLLDAAARTSGPTPEAAQLKVPLATHEMLLTRRPTIDVLAEDRRILSIDVEIKVKIMLVGLAAVVERGRIAALLGGDCTVEVAIAIERVEIDRREIHVEPGVLLPLGGGIPLSVPRQRAP